MTPTSPTSSTTSSTPTAAPPPPPRTSYTRSLLRHSWLIAVGAVLGLAIAVAVTSNATKEYSARASLHLSLGYSNSASDINQGAQYTRGEMLSYSELARSATILQPVVRELDLDESPGALAGRISVTTPPDTSVLHIAATHESPRLAASIANAVAASLSQYAVAHSPVDDELGPLISVTTIASAATPTAASSPRLTVNLAAGLLLGTLAGLLGAMALQRGDTRLRTAADIRAVTDAPLLGTLERHRRAHPAESIHRVAAGLRHSLGLRPADAVVITPVAARSSMAELAESLAAALSATGIGSTAMDGSLRERGHGHGQGDAHGGRASAELPVSEALGAVTGALAALREDSDVVLISTPAVTVAADTALLASVASDAIVVVEAGVARAEQLATVLQQLDSAGLEVRGVILSEVHQPRVAGHGAGSAERGTREASESALLRTVRAVAARGSASAGRSPAENPQHG